MNKSIIAIDVGNTTCEVALIGNALVVEKFYVSSNPLDLLQLKLKILEHKIDFKDKLCLISSVVPSKNHNLVDFFVNEFNVNAIIIEHNMFPDSLFSDYLIKSEIGIDILCKSLWAKEVLKKEALILDTGTATVLQYINNEGSLSGASITIGFNTIFNQLHISTDLLPKVDVHKEVKVLGLNTTQALQGGIYWGYIGCLNSLINKSMEQTQCDNVYITGGNSEIFLDDINFKYIHNKNIIFEGIYALYKNNYN